MRNALPVLAIVLPLLACRQTKQDPESTASPSSAASAPNEPAFSSSDWEKKANELIAQPMRSCNVEATGRNSKIVGTIVIELLIDERGKLTTSTILSDAVKDAELNRCLKQAFAGVSYPTAPRPQRMKIDNVFKQL